MQGMPGTAYLKKVSPTTLQTGEEMTVPFGYNPEKITYGHSSRVEGITGQSNDDQIKNLGYVEIGINKVVFAGPDTLTHCNTLIIWSYPVDPAGNSVYGQHGGTDSGKNQSVGPTTPVDLQFTWGSQITSPLRIRKVDVTYTRFASDGTPIRAEVSIGLYQDRSRIMPGTNPTSGGPSGRRARVLDSSDRLPALAATTYGRASAWRQIARANGVDDPLRMKPGTTVYLPEPGEMAAAAAPPGAGR
jgi:hypothetical protein